MRALIRFALLATLIISVNSHSKCIYPTPDDGDITPSIANIHGDITKVSGAKVFIKNKKNGRISSISLNKHSEYYTAFGGDFPPSALHQGQLAWVWFTQCKEPKSGEPEAAYFQIFSTDPKDKPSSN